MSYKKGFTLIELLVVISIISLLSSVVLASLKTARNKAMDSRRLSDLKQVQIALELYRNENNTYPPVTNTNSRENSCGPSTTNNTVHIGEWESALQSTLVGAGYIASLPEDPSNPPYAQAGNDFCYAYYSNVNEANPSIWKDCIDIVSGTMANIRNHGYVIYYSTNQTPTSGFRPNWGGSSPPSNRCLVGPLIR